MNLGPVHVVVDHRFELGENPLWDDRRGVLFWTDIDAGELWRYDPKADQAERIYRGPKVGGFTLQDNGSLLLFRVDDLAIFDPDSEAGASPMTPFEDPLAERFNDVIALPDGSAYAGTIASRPSSGGLFHVGLDGTIECLFRGTDVSNGMAVLDAGRGLLWTDSTAGQIVRFTRDPETNRLSGSTTLYQSTQNEGVPDGLARDRRGRIWSARWDGGCVAVHAPDGEVIGRIEVPTSRVTSVAFGGDDLATLYITTSQGPVYALAPEVRGFTELRTRMGV
ncbi:MAG TPA: SMP-30/gluconolactonase/LRE family protein [Phycisphaerales bacterium]|nr:SMP-30/gluconolactonase/LRE family protein [Phycisphaerales bacterium]